MHQGKKINYLAIWSFVLYSFSVCVPVNAQLMSHVDCFLPVGWEGKEAKLVVNILHQSPLIDTATVVNRHAVFTVSLAEYSPAYIWLEGNSEDIHFFLDAPRIDIAFDPKGFAQPLISGSPSSELWLRQRRLLHQLNESHSKVREDFFTFSSPTDSLSTDSLSVALAAVEPITDSLNNAYNETITHLIIDSPEAPSSWHLFASTMSGLPYSASISLFDKLAIFRSYPSYEPIKAKLSRNKVGQQANDFNWLTLTGDSISLSKQTNKVVLIDFSTSYMTACQRRHGALKKLYAQYHPLGLEIITISNEFDQKSGKELIDKEKLPWPIVLSIPGASDLSVNYPVGRVPDNLLIDIHKTIIGRDMSVQTLESILKTVLKKE